METNDKINFIFYFIMFFMILFFIGIVIMSIIISIEYYNLYNKPTNDLDHPLDNNQVQTSISTKSTSMLPEIQPYMTVVKEKYLGQDLLCGHLYTYKKGNKSIIHRFVYEDSIGNLYFKGDNNNYYDQPIKREDLTYIVKQLNYR